MFRTLLFAVAACFALAGCNTADFSNQLTSVCANAKPVIGALQVLADAGELSPKNAQRFGVAKTTVDNFCANPPKDIASAAITVATTYVLLMKIKKEES